YLYTASGEKTQKKVTEKGVVTLTDYLGGFQYVKGKLSFLPTAEGFFNAETNTYVYQYKDHLGNVRLSYSDKNNNNTIEASEIIEETNYYPFGLAHKGYNQKNDALMKDYKYKYQDQERQNELELNWDSFKWRNYNYAIGRFMNIDPLSEKYPYQSHYNFSENRVIDGRELEGLEVVLINPNRNLTPEQQASEQRVIDGSKNLPKNNTLITVVGHGSPKSMSNDVRQEKITTASNLNAVLNRNSDDWKNKNSGEGMTIVLYSCRTGSDIKDNDGKTIKPSFAQIMSSSEEFKDVEIIAPDQRMYFSSSGPVGAFKAKYAGSNDEYKRDANGQIKGKEKSNTPGNWNVFKNGELIRSY
ncbi:MAG: hypothetical protein LBI73_13610, partial [Myroides sp.]|nr:hypothetical protein [Myroides sp.]